jgi:rRNA-processing protein FCF1
MKKTLLFIMLAFSITFSGCSKKDTPENAANEFMNSFVNGDFEAFKKYSTPQTQTMFALAMAMKCDKNTMENNPGKCLQEIANNDKKFEIISVKKTDGTNAVVTLKEYLKSGQTKEVKVPVVKTEDGWKVNVKK